MQYDLLRLVQGQLKLLGYYTGHVDGQPGPLTSQAVIDFKREHGLRARDLIGLITLSTLFGPDAKAAPEPSPLPGEPLWLAEARRLLGTREVPGPGNNPKIMQWAEDLDQWYPDDATPWCGLFVAHCMAKGAPSTPQEFNRLGARAWRAYGVRCEPSVGAIAVFWRTHPKTSYNGHVGFIVGADDDAYHILGGNQSDNVTITRVAKFRLLECRAPAGFEGDTNLQPVIGGGLSRDEA
ncbi:MAG: TIGR02594 family protein [Pikeienuella sp.]